MKWDENEELLKEIVLGVFAILVLFFINPELFSWFWLTFIRIVIAVFFTWTIVSFIVHEEVSTGSIVVAVIGFIVYLMFAYYTDMIWDVGAMITYVMQAVVIVCVFKIFTKELKGRIEKNF